MNISFNSALLRKILFVSHKKSQCGVYEFGKSIADALQKSRNYQFIRVECSSLTELHKLIIEHKPSAIIYNYVSSVMPWVASPVAPRLWRNNIASIPIPQIGIIHEVTQHVADTATNYKKRFLLAGGAKLSNSLFDYYIAPDPTLLLRNPIVFKTGRLIPSYQNNSVSSSKLTIGSFGFGTPQKGFEKIVQLVQEEFDQAVIRLNIPAADFGNDKNGGKAKDIAEKCKDLVVKPGIKVIVTHEFLDNTSMLDFLAENTINVFLYEHDETSTKGLSSAVDNAMAVQRPVAISDSIAFRHLLDVEPSICINKNNLKTIIYNGFAPLQKHYTDWNEENLIWEYERILNAIFASTKQKNKVEQKVCLINKLKAECKGILNLPSQSFGWVRNSEAETEDDRNVNRSVKYQPVQIPTTVSLNRILDDQARILYAPAIEKIMELVPKTMAKKIPEANVQQAFVFDTVYRFLAEYDNPKILCVGSNEDTASMSLLKMGFEVEEIDPTLNYYLQEYFTKPSTVKNSYDIIFSTSVIEHDPDDESFIRCIAELLSPGGVAVITCDYKDNWLCNEPKPECNARFYTQHDLKKRLLPLMSNCNLVDSPQWDCPDPDFNYLGKYQYTFATFVVKKERIERSKL